ncbi:hypothetical protein MRX96_038688 [Rhipicephalus microplus]
MPYGSICKYTCKRGWRLVDPIRKTAVDGFRKCLENGKWQGANQKITCRDAEPPEIMNCPGDIQVNNAPHSPFSDPVTWEEPTARDNSGIEKHVIQYVAVDGEKLESKPCTFRVTVRDVEPPRIMSCPDDIILFSAAKKVNITWEKPTFTDNGGNVTITLRQATWSFHLGTTEYRELYCA